MSILQISYELECPKAIIGSLTLGTSVWQGSDALIAFKQIPQKLSENK